MDQLKLYDRVAITHDIAEHDLRRGDVATLIDLVPHPGDGPQGLVLEVVNALGESLRVIVVTPDDVAPLNANEVFAVRELSRTG